ncbi:aryl-sulfate sulfotransferase [Draconibacterium sp.]|nr:aryl-sulfate sulfotransferase [Draconibacterium sp.]
MIEKMKVYSLFGLLIFILVACEASKIKFLKEPVVVQNPNESVPLSCFIDFETETEYKNVTFTIKDSEREFQLEYTPSEKITSGYLIFLMRPEQQNKIAIEITDLKGRKHLLDKELLFKTPALPKSDMEFPGIEISHFKAKFKKEELTLFNPRRRVPLNFPGSNKLNQSFGMLSITNSKGEIVWYYRTDSRISDFDLLPNGNLSYMTQDSRVVEIDFAGSTVNQWYAANRPEGKMEGAIAVDALTFHHDVSVLPNGNRLVCSTEIREFDNYYTSELDKNAPRKRQKVMGDVIIEFTPKGEVVHRWKCFDHMPAERIGYETFSNYWFRRGFPGVIDWSHANAVVPIPDEEAYLVNFRYQSAMIKVNKTTSDIEWIFAEPSGWGKDLQNKLLKIPEDGLNWHQHSPRFMANGNLLFFNNNNYQARPFEKTASLQESPSYAVEYNINEQNKTVRRIWDSKIENEKTIVSIAMGRVSEMPETGNILTCFGALLPPDHLDEMTWQNRGRFPQWTMVREYTHTTPAKIVWEMRILPRTKESKVGWTLFGAERIELDVLTKSN